MAISNEIIEKAWEIRQKGRETLREIADYFGVDDKELQKALEKWLKVKAIQAANKNGNPWNSNK